MWLNRWPGEPPAFAWPAELAQFDESTDEFRNNRSRKPRQQLSAVKQSYGDRLADSPLSLGWPVTGALLGGIVGAPDTGAFAGLSMGNLLKAFLRHRRAEKLRQATSPIPRNPVGYVLKGITRGPAPS